MCRLSSSRGCEADANAVMHNQPNTYRRPACNTRISAEISKFVYIVLSVTDRKYLYIIYIVSSPYIIQNSNVRVIVGNFYCMKSTPRGYKKYTYLYISIYGERDTFGTQRKIRKRSDDRKLLICHRRAGGKRPTRYFNGARPRVLRTEL